MRASSELRPTAPTPETSDASSASRCDRCTPLAAVTGLQITTDVLEQHVQSARTSLAAAVTASCGRIRSASSTRLASALAKDCISAF